MQIVVLSNGYFCLFLFNLALPFIDQSPFPFINLTWRGEISSNQIFYIKFPKKNVSSSRPRCFRSNTRSRNTVYSCASNLKRFNDESCSNGHPIIVAERMRKQAPLRSKFTGSRECRKTRRGKKERHLTRLHKRAIISNHQISSLIHLIERTTTTTTTATTKSDQWKITIAKKNLETFENRSRKKKILKMVHIEDIANVDIQETGPRPDSGITSGSGLPGSPILQCYHNPPAELDPYIYVVLTSL